MHYMFYNDSNLCMQAVAANKTDAIFWLLQGSTLVVTKWSTDPWTWTAKKPTTSGAAFLSQVCYSYKYCRPSSVTLHCLWHGRICKLASVLPLLLACYYYSYCYNCCF